MTADIIARLEDKLNKLTIHELRQVGRAAGVNSPSDKKKNVLIGDILNIAKGIAPLAPRSVKGAHPKSEIYDKELVGDIESCRAYFLNLKFSESKPELKVASPQVYDGANLDVLGDDKEYSGVLEFTDKYWFLRTGNCQISSSDDVFMHISFINRFRLKTGDFIVCKARRRKEGECPGVTYICSINGISPDRILPRVSFEGLIPCYPDRRFTLEGEGSGLTERVIDLFSPIGNGQRALIVSPPKAGKTTALKTIACSIIRNNPDVKVIILLIDERPEEVTDITRSVKGAEIIYSTFDKGEQHHIHTASLAMEYAKRLVEVGRNVVVLMDSLTRLTRAYNSCSNSGRILSGGLDPQALVEPKRIFGAARNVENGGSLTVIATALIDTGSKLDNIIYEEFKSAGNMEIVLSRDLAESRIFPAIDIKASGARKEEYLLSERELYVAGNVRKMMRSGLKEEDLLKEMSRAENNAIFCKKFDEWIKVDKK